MKKFYIINALVLWGIAQMICAQNMYRNYQSTAVTRPESAVSVVHSNGYVYYFQADTITKRLSITEIDPLSMLTTGNNWYMQYNIEFVLNGGFEDFNGNFVLFGYDKYNSVYPWYPTIMVVDPNFLNFDLYKSTTLKGSFIAGCVGYDINGNELYTFISDMGKLYAVNKTSLSLFRELTANPIFPFFDSYTDISWDSYHNRFVAVGSAMPNNHDHLHPFVEILELDVPPSMQNNAVAYNDYSYILENIAYRKVTEHKAMHVQLNPDELLLYRDLQEETNDSVHDIVWLTRIYNFWNTAATISESYYYLLPDAKLTAKDMIYDFTNNKINILGVFNNCMYGLTQLLAQADPFSLVSGLNVGQLGGAFVGNPSCQSTQSPSVNVYYNDLYMRNLAFNYYNPCGSILIAGSNGKGSVLTETYDVSASSCDMPLAVREIAGNPYIKPYGISITIDTSSFVPIQIYFNSDIVKVNKICDESAACSHQYGGKLLQQPKTQGRADADIVIEHNLQFFCNGYNGSIQYFLYDIAGKLLQEGSTQNGRRNKISVSKGVYLLKATDTVGHQVVKKIVLI